MNKRISLVLVLLTGFLFSSFWTGSSSFKIKTIVIDAGHGGKDPGCLGATHKEKEVALAVALRLGDYIERNFKDVKVIYTRKTDVFVELQERAAIANNANADLFICIHCNASVNKSVYGSETYVMGLHKTKGNLDVAKRENASILMEDNYKKKYEGFDPNSDEANIIFSMYQNAHLDQSLNLASKIQLQYKNKAGRSDKGVKQAGFLVLWKTAMPSLLTEIGFLTNPEEEVFLGSEKGQDHIAASIFRAFRKYKDETEGNNLKYDDEVERKIADKIEKENVAGTNGNKKIADETNASKEKTPADSLFVEPATNKSPSISMKNNMSAPSDLSNANNLSEENNKETKKDIIKKEDTKTIHPSENPISFRIQILSSAKQLPSSSAKFKGLENINEYIDGGIYKYTAGDFKTLEPAAKFQSELKKKGFTDAFVVKFKDGKRVVGKQ